MRKLTGDSSDIYRGDGTFAPVIIPEPPPGGVGTVTNDASLTDNAVVVGDGGTDGVKSLVALGTAGDVLTSNGPGVPPSFQAPAAAVQVFSGHYGGGVPTDVPTTSAAIAYDLDPPYVMSKWDGAAWS